MGFGSEVGSNIMEWGGLSYVGGVCVGVLGIALLKNDNSVIFLFIFAPFWTSMKFW